MAPDADVLRALALSVQIIGRPLTEQETAQFLRYLGLLSRWNRKARLSAITKPVEVVRLHFLDSLLSLRAELPAATRVIDVGSGAGFPGIPVKIVRPDLQLTLLEAASHRAAFLEIAGKEMGLELEVIHARAEEAAHEEQWRERFDGAMARALAPLASACELTMPFVKPNGRVVLLKGPSVRSELAAGRRTVGKLGGGVMRTLDAALPGGDRRVIIVIEKSAPTPTQYPRRAGLPRRKPLGGPPA